MSNTTKRRRLAALEARAGKGDGARAYVCYPTAAACDAARAVGAIPAGVKVYVGVCPDDWEVSSHDHGKQTATA